MLKIVDPRFVELLVLRVVIICIHFLLVKKVLRRPLIICVSLVWNRGQRVLEGRSLEFSRVWWCFWGMIAFTSHHRVEREIVRKILSICLSRLFFRLINVGCADGAAARVTVAGVLLHDVASPLLQVLQFLWQYIFGVVLPLHLELNFPGWKKWLFLQLCISGYGFLGDISSWR